MSLYIPKMSDTPAITIPGLAANFEELDSHLADLTNPHSVTAAQVPYTSSIYDWTPGDVAAGLDVLAGSRIVDHNFDVVDPPNGYYVRWENGLQVCWRQEIVGTVQDFPSTFNNLDDRPFPAVFAELAGIQATVGVTSNVANVRGAFYIASDGAALNRWVRLCIVRHANASGGAAHDVYVNLLAIGRWK